MGTGCGGGGAVCREEAHRARRAPVWGPETPVNRDGSAPLTCDRWGTRREGCGPDVGAGRGLAGALGLLLRGHPAPRTHGASREEPAGQGPAVHTASSQPSVGRNREGDTNTSVVRAPVPKVCAKAPQGATGPAQALLGILDFRGKHPSTGRARCLRVIGLSAEARSWVALPSCCSSRGGPGGKAWGARAAASRPTLC